MPDIENNGIGIANWDAPIYRIFGKRWLLEWLKTQRNGLVPPSSWDDPFENFFLRCSAVTADGASVSLHRLHDSWFGQCWTLKPESDAMWRIYSKRKSGIRVSTTIRKLFGAFYDTNDSFASLKFAIGQIRYIQRADIESWLARTSFADLTIGGQIHGLAETLCIKRPEFSHEEEVRLLFHDAENKYAGKPVFLSCITTASVIDDVLLDPRIGSRTVKAVTRELRSAGYAGPVSQSQLYSFTPPTITLE